MKERKTTYSAFVHVPNSITCFRIVGSVALLLLSSFSPAFYILYSLCGISDAVDGFIARRFKLTSDLGSRLDSIADLLFYASMLTHVIPFLVPRVPTAVWYVVGALVLMRIGMYSLTAVKYRRFSSLHTYANKATGVVLFCVPYLLLFANAVTVSWVACVACAVSSIEELLIHCIVKEYPDKAKSIIHVL